METTPTVLDNILSVFDSIGTWISDSVTNLMPMFYDSSTGLTFLGVLAVAGLAFSVIFLIIGLISNFLHFRG
jgi:hypothetical protein